MEYDSLAGTMQTSRLFLPGLMPRIISQCCCYVDFVLDFFFFFFFGGGGEGGGILQDFSVCVDTAVHFLFATLPLR